MNKREVGFVFLMAVFLVSGAIAADLNLPGFGGNNNNNPIKLSGDSHAGSLKFPTSVSGFTQNGYSIGEPGKTEFLEKPGIFFDDGASIYKMKYDSDSGNYYGEYETCNGVTGVCGEGPKEGDPSKYVKTGLENALSGEINDFLDKNAHNVMDEDQLQEKFDEHDCPPELEEGEEGGTATGIKSSTEEESEEPVEPTETVENKKELSEDEQSVAEAGTASVFDTACLMNNEELNDQDQEKAFNGFNEMDDDKKNAVWGVMETEAKKNYMEKFLDFVPNELNGELDGKFSEDDLGKTIFTPKGLQSVNIDDLKQFAVENPSTQFSLNDNMITLKTGEREISIEGKAAGLDLGIAHKETGKRRTVLNFKNDEAFSLTGKGNVRVDSDGTVHMEGSFGKDGLSLATPEGEKYTLIQNRENVKFNPTTNIGSDIAVSSADGKAKAFATSGDTLILPKGEFLNSKTLTDENGEPYEVIVDSKGNEIKNVIWFGKPDENGKRDVVITNDGTETTYFQQYSDVGLMTLEGNIVGFNGDFAFSTVSKEGWDEITSSEDPPFKGASGLYYRKNVGETDDPEYNIGQIDVSDEPGTPPWGLTVDGKGGFNLADSSGTVTVTRGRIGAEPIIDVEYSAGRTIYGWGTPIGNFIGEQNIQNVIKNSPAMKSAYNEAKASGKNFVVMFSGKNCPPCNNIKNQNGLTDGWNEKQRTLVLTDLGSPTTRYPYFVTSH